MRKLQISDANVMFVAVQQEILRSEDSRYDHRLHGILLVCSGLSCYEVADLLGHSPRTVESWVNHFEQNGFAALQDTPHPGRPPALDEARCEAVGRELRRSPRQFGYSQNLWDGRLLSHHLAARYGVKLGVRQCQRLFHRLGFRLRKPRPVIAKADPEAQARYKRTARSGRQGRS